MNEATIRRLGAQGALTVKDVVAACGAGSDCAQCVPLIQAVLDEETGLAGGTGRAQGTGRAEGTGVATSVASPTTLA